MKTILEMLANDKIQVSSRYYQHRKEYTQTYETFDKLGKKILEKLDEEGKELFYKYDSLMYDLASIIRTNEFVYGYQLGALTIIDVYSVFNSPAFTKSAE